ncbi:MAG: hypothetical protein JM58_15435 [Peptococcaceae bacterium BICA1-8]|nr:MAG: hypothetical protein JM58_15435 [Peptococcaceae bacterium BICA1-8]
MNRKKIIVYVTFLLLILLLVGCGKREIHIRGNITQIETIQKGMTSILVEGEIEPDTSFDKASIAITEKTKIYRGKERISLGSLEGGIKVEVEITGPVRESYPVQATAKAVWVIECECEGTI